MKTAKLFLLLSVIIIICSCSTFIVTNDDLEYATDYAIDIVLSSAQRSIYGHFRDEESFIPDEYCNLITYKDSIPGMNMLLDNWRKYMSAHMLQNIEDLEQYFSLMSSDTKVINIQSSDTAVTDCIRSVYEDRIIEAIDRILRDADYSILENCITQYNRWVKITKQYYLIQIKMSNADIRDKLTERFLLLFFEELESAERHFRNTKDAYVDGRVAAVFNLR